MIESFNNFKLSNAFKSLSFTMLTLSLSLCWLCVDRAIPG